jgi:hypothetical protein
MDKKSTIHAAEIAAKGYIYGETRVAKHYSTKSEKGEV